MKKIILLFITIILMAPTYTLAADNYDTHIVKKGDTMWKIAVAWRIGVQEIIDANPQIENPNLIYPMQQLSIPLRSSEEISTEEEILYLVNKERKKAGISALTLNWQLSRVAKAKSQDMADRNYFSHQSPTYGSPFDMIKKFGIKYTAAGENIAAGQKTPEAVMTAWMNSSGHRANILSSNYTQLGVGKATGGSYGIYWTQQFIRP